MYEEIKKLHEKLTEAKIPHVFEPIWDGYGCWVGGTTQSDCLFDAVQHSGSYGGKEGFLETMGTPTDEDDVTGWRTVDDVFKEFEQEYKKERGII